MKHKFFKKLFTSGIAAAIILTPSLKSMTNQAKKIDLTSQQVYSQMIENHSYNYDSYLNRVNPFIQETEIEFKNLLKGNGDDIPSEKERKRMYKNMVSEYKETHDTKSRFENSLNNLDRLVYNDWKEFTSDEYTIVDRYNDIINIFKDLEEQFRETKIDFKVRTLQFKNPEIRDKDPYLGRKLVINEKTLSYSYKLVEWYRLILINRVKYWVLKNPRDSKATMKEHETFLKAINTFIFNLADNK